MWNDVYTPTDDLSRLKWSGDLKVVILAVAKECRGFTYITVDDLAPHGDESVEFSGDLTVPTGAAGLGHGHATRFFGIEAKARHGR